MKAIMVGFGQVGRSLRTLLQGRAKELGVEVEIEAVVTRRGIMIGDGEEFRKTRDGTAMDALNLIGPDLVIDVSSANYQTGEPSLSLYIEALRRGVHVVTSNKAPLALKFWEIMDTSRRHGGKLGFQATVMSGVPSVNLIRVMPGLKITMIRGILNGTTNYILSKMYQGLSYEEALKEAQELGYAESNPEHDVNGFDAAAKLVILANYGLGSRANINSVHFKGIKELSQERIIALKRQGKKVKLVAEAYGNSLTVEPREIGPEDPLYNIDGVTNALHISSDVQEITVIGPGAGPLNAAFGVFSDIVLMSKGLY